ncbi:MAG: hypothetical protein ABIH72_04375 [archaeon]
MANMVDVSGLEYYMPIFSFLFIFVIIFALLAKTKLLGENKFINLIISFVIAIIFTLITSIRSFVETVVPWFAVLIVALFFVLMIIGFSQKKMEDMMKPGLAWVFIALLVIVFLVAAIVVFPGTLEPLYDDFTDWTDSGGIAGGILLIIIAAIAAWVVAKG